MSSRPTPALKSYPVLLRDVKRVLFAGRRDIEVAWVRTYHETGRLIHEHLLLKQARADYGAKLYIRLAHDTKVSSRTLRECVQFFRRYPIWRHVAKLGWNCCRLLCQVEDEAQRGALTIKAVNNDWASGEIVKRVRALNAAIALDSDASSSADAGLSAHNPGPKLLVPKLGTAGLHQIIARDDGLAIDVGFKLYLPLADGAARMRACVPGAIVRVETDGTISAAEGAMRSDLYTYRARIRRVIDGDTLGIDVMLPHFVMSEKLRLRGLDCPEMDTAEGKTARRVVEALVADAEEVTIVTSKVDKYDRYLADVHLRFRPGSKSAEDLGQTECFLNNYLLAQGHARRMDASGQTDWTP